MSVRDMTYAAMFAALMAIGANITAYITVGTVPLTMQTFFAIMAGTLLGSRLGAVAMLVYMFVGLAGAPVLAGFSGGPGVLLKPTFGFVISFIVLAYVTGKIIELRKNPGFITFLIASFVGLVLNYVIGTTLMFVTYNTWGIIPDFPNGVSYGLAWAWMLPFLPKDIFFTVIAAVIAPKIYRAIHRSGYNKQTEAAYKENLPIGKP